MLRIIVLAAITALFATVGVGCSQNVGPSLGSEKKGNKPALQTSSSKPNVGGTEEKSNTEVAAATAEQTLRTFLIAMMTKDEATLRAVTLPTKDFDWLLRGQAVPADQIEEIKAQITRLPIRALKPGDEVILPGNRKTTVAPEAVTADDAMLMAEGHPLPHSLRKVDGRWRVDAGPIIAGRKAADKARQKLQTN